jgi:hypothetical protein
MADAVDASVAVLQTVASGDVTPDEAGRVVALLSAHKGITAWEAFRGQSLVL